MITEKRNIKVVNEYRINNIQICHGDKIIKTTAKTIIIAHEHPAISLQHGVRTEKYKCFLKGKWKKKNLIVLPSFNLVTEGTNVLKEKLLSPYLDQKLDDFEAYIVSDKIYEFGKLRDLR